MFLKDSILFSLAFHSQLPSLKSFSFHNQAVHSLWIEAIKIGNSISFLKYVDQVDIDCRDDQGYTGLYYAVDHGRIGMLRLLLQRQINLELPFGSDASTLLHRTILNYGLSKGYSYVFFEIARTLLQSGASVSSLDSGHMTPLHRASLVVDDPSLLQLLMDYSADINAVNLWGCTPLMLSVSRNFVLNVGFFLQNEVNIHCADNQQQTALLFATRFNLTPCISKLLIDSGVDINVKDRLGYTPLLFSVQKGWEDLVECLLLKGATVDASSLEGETPLIVAVRKGYASIVKQLIRFDANVEQLDSEGKSLLVLASKGGRASIVETLILNKAEVNFLTPEGETALMYATYHGSLKTVQVLVQNGANINKRNYNGWTAMMIASRFGYADIVRYLSYNGADMNFFDNFQQAYEIAFCHGYFDIADFLLNFQIKIQSQNVYILLKSLSWNKCVSVARIILKHTEEKKTLKGITQMGLYFKGTILVCCLNSFDLKFQMDVSYLDSILFNIEEFYSISLREGGFSNTLDGETFVESLESWDHYFLDDVYNDANDNHENILCSLFLSHTGDNIPIVTELKNKFSSDCFERVSSIFEFTRKRLSLDPSDFSIKQKVCKRVPRNRWIANLECALAFA